MRMRRLTCNQIVAEMYLIKRKGIYKSFTEMHLQKISKNIAHRQKIVYNFFAKLFVQKRHRQVLFQAEP